jgi:hypothetical protein
MASNNLKQILINEGIKQTEFLEKLAQNGGKLSAGSLNKMVNKKRAFSETTENKIYLTLDKLFPGKYKREDVFPKAGRSGFVKK